MSIKLEGFLENSIPYLDGKALISVLNLYVEKYANQRIENVYYNANDGSVHLRLEDSAFTLCCDSFDNQNPYYHFYNEEENEDVVFFSEEEFNVYYENLINQKEEENYESEIL
jgi:hypothetical protein